MADSFTIGFDLRDVRNAFKRQVKIAPLRAVEALRKCIDTVFIPAIKKQITNQNLVSSGDLLSSIKTVVSFDKNNPSVEMLVDVPYAANIELGTPRGREPDLRRLNVWVRKKKKGEFPVSEVAIKVANKIRKKGIKKRPFVQPAFDSTKGQFLQCFADHTDLR